MTQKTVDMLTAFVPFSAIEKSDKGKEGSWIISGLASTPDLDFQGEVILPEGINYTDYFEKNGWITYEHGHEVSDIIGEPLDASIDDEGFRIKAKLYKESPKAQEVWTLQKALANESGSGRHLGFSIEGPVTSRDPNNPKVITGVQIRNVTVTSHPANPNATWNAVTKSMEVGYPTDPTDSSSTNSWGVLTSESLATAITMLTFALDHKSKDNILGKVQKDLEKAGLLNEASLSLILQLGRGVSADRAHALVSSIYGANDGTQQD